MSESRITITKSVSEKKHKREPTTYPKPEDDKTKMKDDPSNQDFHPFSEKRFTFYGENTESPPKVKKEKQPGCFGCKR